ncbi:carboxylesterase family protein [Tellurirhabdus bombi]|uniref:carboxylesterase family protein n=1 Tax=Tellurirhabdus bombi TaxID=2907205 RepID=UPI001EEB898B|nr:alpha/beta hydrolase-fold protein [Tellurirhabdus bombi]
MINYLRTLLPVLFLLAMSHFSYAQKLQPGPQVLTFFSDVDDTEQPYGLYLPKNYNPKKKYPLVIMLHGAGSNHRLSLRRVFGKSNANGENDVESTRYFPEWADVNYIVASPFARGTAGYQGVPEKDVYDVLADVKRRFNVDEDRTYLTGLSMGGGGTLWIGTSRPDIWAAIAPVCPAPPKGTDALAPNLLNVPAHFFHGDKDPSVPVAVSRDWTKRLKELGSTVEYIEYPGVEHNSWENAYKDEFIFSWFKQFKRNRFPDRVRYSSANYKYNQAYWVQFDQLTPGTLASIDAKFTGKNRLEITSNNLDGLTLNLAGHSQYKAGKPLDVVVDGKSIQLTGKDALSLVRQAGVWSETNAAMAKGKRKGAEGPLSEAFASRHVYVYGTGGNPTPEELKTRAELATQAANWSVDRGAFLGRVMVFPRVMADKDVRPSDLENANLVLFGTKETNSLINQYSDRLPIHLASTATDYGLFYIMPVNNHYVAVSSGLPWWTENGGQVVGRPMPKPLSNPAAAQDYFLFKGTPKDVIAEGKFDTNWHLPESEASKMTATGVVTVATGAVSSTR